MKALNLKGFAKVSQGDKAAIHQYLSRLEDYFLPSTDVTILLKNNENEEPSGFQVELKITEGGSYMMAQGQGETLLSAIKSASDLILNQFVQIQTLVQQEREKLTTPMEAKKIEVSEEDLDLEYKKSNWH
jgi:ribosome-associated translation inhibitor RaiA